MRLLLDTTYFLPAIGVSIKGIPRNAAIELLREGHEVGISEVTLFELSAKGAKYAAAGALNPERVVRGVRALRHDERVVKVPPYDAPVLLLALRLREMLSDFIDCLILSTAVNWADLLVTEDGDILELAQRKDFKKITQPVNPSFKVLRLRDIL